MFPEDPGSTHQLPLMWPAPTRMRRLPSRALSVLMPSNRSRVPERWPVVGQSGKRCYRAMARSLGATSDREAAVVSQSEGGHQGRSVDNVWVVRSPGSTWPPGTWHKGPQPDNPITRVPGKVQGARGVGGQCNPEQGCFCCGRRPPLTFRSRSTRPTDRPTDRNAACPPDPPFRT